MIKVNDYKTGNWPFPSHEIDPKLKGKEWLMAFCQAMFSAWIRDKTALPYSLLNEYASLRAYGAGKQDPEIYQDLLLGPEDNQNKGNTEREGWLNINWDIFSPAVKFKNVVIGIMEGQEHDIQATAIDPISGDEREEKKWDLWFQAQYKEGLQYIDRNMGIQRSQDEFIPENLQELNIYEELGGFKLKKEYAMERGIDFTLYISDWKEIKRKLFNDLMDIGATGTKDYVDKFTGKVRCRYSNPSRLIIQYSKHYNHRNSEGAGEVIPMKIVDIRGEAPDISEDDLREIAFQYQGITGTRHWQRWASRRICEMRTGHTSMMTSG